MLKQVGSRVAGVVALAVFIVAASAGDLGAQGLKLVGYADLEWTAQETNDQRVGLMRLASSDPTFFVVDEPSGADLYKKNCAVCHGEEGKGDGPAAAALTPRPTELTDAEGTGKLTDEELLELISKGKGTMPGYAALLNPDELKAVLEYVRGLGAKDEKK